MEEKTVMHKLCDLCELQFSTTLLVAGDGYGTLPLFGYINFGCYISKPDSEKKKVWSMGYGGSVHYAWHASNWLLTSILISKF